MRLPPWMVNATEEVLRTALSFSAPASHTLSHYCREHPRLGARERGVIAEALYSVLRNKLVYAHLAESGKGAAMRRLALLGLVDASHIDALGGLSEEERDWLQRVISLDRATLPARLRANLPDWLFDELVECNGEQEAQELAQAFNDVASLDLRVNILKTHREAVMKDLAQASIACCATPYAPLGIRVLKKWRLQNLPLFTNGMIEVQDEGSQLLTHIVGARRGEMVADFCAGAGGKTLSLGAFMRNTGRLYAFDISEKRLSRLKPRLARSGLSNVHPVVIAHENDTRIKRLSGKMDRVLVDAPCSGLGTLRRSPDLKWRQTPQAVEDYSKKQQLILNGAARLVKPGGRLVYATCSILDRENERVATTFLAARDDFKLKPIQTVLEEQKIALDMEGKDYLKLLPHRHQTDGFFAAVFERKK